MTVDGRHIYGREAVDLAKVLRCTVDVVGVDGVPVRCLADLPSIAGMLAAGQGSRISLNVDAAAERLTRRICDLAKGTRSVWWALAMLCAVERVLREYEQP